MPGLVGIISKSLNKAENLARYMTIPLQVYDWYKLERFTYDDLSIVHVHTDILPEQEFVFRDDICVCIHGEIYNQDLKDQNQAEYVVNLYKEYGKMFPKYLNGSFAIFLFDGKKGTTYLITDRVASKPIFYYSDNERFIFAPELKCILRIPNTKFSVDKHAVADVLSNHHIPSNRTLVEEVLLLEPASILAIKKGQLSIEKYWRYAINENAEDLGFDYYYEKLSQLLQKAVSIRVSSNHRYGLSLSGGHDSRILLGCCKPYTDRMIAFSYGNYLRPYTDAGTARRLAEIVGMEHIFYPYYNEDHFDNQLAFIHALDGMGCCQGLADTVPAWKRAREEHGIQILFCGDNLFGDIYSHHDFEIDEEYMFRSLIIHSLERTQQFRSLLKPGYFEWLVELSRENMNDLSRKCELQDICARREYFHLEATTFRYYSPWRYAISREMEVRTPWYDSEILDFIRAVPFKYRHDKGLFKQTGFLMFPELFEVGIAKDRAQVSRLKQLYSIRKRKKDILTLLVDGESPVDEMFNKGKIKHLLSDRRLNYLAVKSFISYSANRLVYSMKLFIPANVKQKLKNFRKRPRHRGSEVSGRPLEQHLGLEQILLRIMKLRVILKGESIVSAQNRNGEEKKEW